MNIFSIDVTLNELTFIRQSLDAVSVSGKDAKFLANLQIKLEQEIQEAQAMLEEEELKKKKDLEQLILSEQKVGKTK
jgi:hypothetical protein